MAQSNRGLPNELRELMADVLRQQYEGIADRVIPVLGPKPPREMVGDSHGERKLRLWLQGLERNEWEMAEERGREPADLAFVWQQIGIERG